MSGNEIGNLPHQSPDPIAAAFGLTNEQCSVTYERQALEGVASAVQKAAERGPDPFKNEKPIALGSTAWEEPEEKDPTKRDYKEADFSTDVRKWMAKNFTKPCAFELKVSTTDSINFDELVPHQKANLLKVKRGPFPDILRNDGIHKAKRPFDGYFLNKCAAWVIVMYHVKRRGQSEFFVIDVEAWCQEEEKGERRSLTEGRAGEVGFKCSL